VLHFEKLFILLPARLGDICRKPRKGSRGNAAPTRPGNCLPPDGELPVYAVKRDFLGQEPLNGSLYLFLREIPATIPVAGNDVARLQIPHEHSFPYFEDDALQRRIIVTVKPTSLLSPLMRMERKVGESIVAAVRQRNDPVFGMIKEPMHFRRFLLRGIEKVGPEWTIVCIAYNMKRLWRQSQI